jgi:hypothetical protein
VENKQVNKLTRQYVAKLARIAKLEEEAATLKAQIVELAPDGIATPHGTWQAYAESTRQTYSNTDVQKLVEKLILEGNDTAVRILAIRKDNPVQGGVRFLKPKATQE